MSVGRTRQRAGLFAALVLLTGCGARISLGDYVDGMAGLDGAVKPDEPFVDAEPFDVEIDSPPDASLDDDAPFDPEASTVD